MQLSKLSKKSFFYTSLFLLFNFFLLLLLGGCIKQEKDLSSSEVNTAKLQAHHYLTQQILVAQKDSSTHLAIQILKEAIDSTEAIIFPDTILAQAYQQLGILNYTINYWAAAVDNWTRAIKVEKAIKPTNHWKIVKRYRNIGNGLLYDNKWSEARSAFQNALSLELIYHSKDSLLLTDIYNGLGRANYYLENYLEAEKYLYLAKKRIQAQFKNEPWEWIYIYESLFEYFQYSEQSQNMLQIADEILMAYEKVDDLIEVDYENIASAYNNKAMAYEDMELLQKANKAYQQSMLINQQTGNSLALAQNHNNIATVYQKNKAFEKAITAIDFAINYYRKTNRKNDLAKSLATKAMILFDKQQTDKALDLLEQSNQLLRPPYPQLPVQDKDALIENLVDQIKILKYLAKSEGINYLIKTTPIFEEVFSLLDQTRVGILTHESKKFLAEKARPIFESAIDVQINLYQKTQKEAFLIKAFEITEKSKANMLKDAFQEIHARQNTGVPKVVIDKEWQLNKQLATIEKKLNQNAVDSLLLFQEFAILNNQIDSLKNYLALNYPNYYTKKYQTATISFADLKANVQGSIINYFVKDSSIYAFTYTYTATSDKLTFTNIPNKRQLKILISQLRRSIYAPFLLNDLSKKQEIAYRDTFIYTAYQLHQELIEPIIKKQSLDIKLTIIPDGVLHYLPFETLLVEKPENKNEWHNFEYLLNHHHISYNPPLPTLMDHQKKYTSTKKSFLGFAPVFHDKTPPQYAMNRSVSALRMALSPLNYNQSEVSNLQTQLGGKIYTGRQAT
ncbi:MAG: tetratricopeptide repeat protein, partial [Saprospiraceae bacterium]